MKLYWIDVPEYKRLFNDVDTSLTMFTFICHVTFLTLFVSFRLWSNCCAADENVFQIFYFFLPVNIFFRVLYFPHNLEITNTQSNLYIKVWFWGLIAAYLYSWPCGKRLRSRKEKSKRCFLNVLEKWCMYSY